MIVKNHLGDKDEFLPTNHDCDEFFGAPYHPTQEGELKAANWIVTSTSACRT